MGDRWIDDLARRLAGGAKPGRADAPERPPEPEVDEPRDPSRRRLLSRAGILGAAVATYVIPGWTPALAACRRGLTRCGGRCVNLRKSERHCGRCGHRCKSTQYCSKGKCCRKGLTNCRGKCVNLKSSEQHCGRCGNNCAAGKYCSKGKCCPEGTVNCGGTCRNLKTSEAHCGRCGHACAAGQTCENGVCTDLEPTGCTTPDDCGTDTECMTWLCSEGICAQSLVGDGEPCTGGTCQSGVCTPTAAECSGQPDGTTCPGGTCQSGTCTPHEGCVTTSQPCYEGALGTEGVGVCKGGTRYCQEGGTFGPCLDQVTPQPELCNGLDDDCDGTVDNGFDVGAPCSNGQLGACEQTGTTVCSPDGTSVVCNVSSPPVTPTAEVCNGIDDDCDGVIDNGFDLNTDPNNCGSCGTVCSFPNANAICSAGVCMIGSCDSGYADCDDNPSNGCETHPGTDPQNCGGCGIVCEAGTVCSGGICVLV